MPPLYLLEVVLAVAIAVLSPVREPEVPVGSVEGAHVLPSPDERHESWYVLEVARVGADGRERPHVVGLACLRRSVRAGRVRLEAEFRYPDAGSRVLIVEEPCPGGRRLVYRELVDRAGRSVVLEELDGGGYSLLEWGGPEKRSGPLGCNGQISFPLELAEAARVQHVDRESIELFDPLAGRPVRVRAQLVPIAAEPEPVYEVRYERDDGTLAASYRIRSGRIVEFQWQRGGPRARLAPQDEVAEAERRLRSSSPP